jgi:hypothetical protein
VELQKSIQIVTRPLNRKIRMKKSPRTLTNGNSKIP